MNRYPLTLLSVFLLVLWMAGCGRMDGEKIAYISVNPNSAYEQTFQDLNLGIIYDFNLKLTQADQTWVTIWVEGYQDGEQTDPFRLTELSYGRSPDPVVEGPMGFGMIKAQEGNASFFLYAEGASSSPHEIGDILSSDELGGSSWGYAIGDDEELGLESGETKVLGVYRQVEQSLRTYDYQNQEDLERMIREDKTVLLLKMKVEIGEGP